MKKGSSQDRKEVAAKQKWEVAYEAKKWGITSAALLAVMKDLGAKNKSGHPCKSRKKIEAELVRQGFIKK